MNKWVLSTYILVIGLITYFLVFHEKQVSVAMLLDSEEPISSISMDVKDHEYSVNEKSFAELPVEIEAFISYIESLQAREISRKEVRELNRKLERYRNEGKSLSAFLFHSNSSGNQFNGYMTEIAADGTGMIVPMEDGVGRVTYRIENGTETIYNRLYSFYQSHYKKVELEASLLSEGPSDSKIENRLSELQGEVKKAYEKLEYLKGQNASDEKIQKAEEELGEKNKALTDYKNQVD